MKKQRVGDSVSIDLLYPNASGISLRLPLPERPFFEADQLAGSEEPVDAPMQLDAGLQVTWETSPPQV